MWSIYVLKHETTQETYIGLTDDINRRLKEHNRGSQSATRRRAGKWILVYREQYLVKRNAILRERRLKQHGRAKQELLKRIQLGLGD